MALASTLHELSVLLRSDHPLIVVETPEEQRVRELVRAACQSLGVSCFEWSLAQGLQWASGPDSGGNPIATTREPEGVLRHLLSLDRAGVFLLKDFAVHLSEPLIARLLREVCQAFDESVSAVVLTGASIALPESLAHRATWLPFELPGRGELRSMLQSTLRSLSAAGIANEVPGGLDELADAVVGLTLNQARQAVTFAALEDRRLDAADLPQIAERKARLIQDAGLLEYYAPADNRFELGGFERLLDWLGRMQQGFRPEARELGLPPPRGLLLTGVQGCGKSLAAKVVARRWNQPLLKLEAGRLYDKYVGESEKNLRRAFAIAESLAPCVLWIDEIEKAFGSSGDSEQDGGLARRIQGQLLTWLQERESAVFVVATSNDIFALPPELMRRGRFDEIFFVDLPAPSERRAIFAIHLSLRRQDPECFALDDLVFASEGMSGAEIEAAVVAALYRALHEESALENAHLLRELDALVPLSVSRREEVERLRAHAEGRFARVGG